MKYTASLDKLAKIVTVTVTIIFVLGIAAQFSFIGKTGKWFPFLP